VGFDQSLEKYVKVRRLCKG